MNRVTLTGPITPSFVYVYIVYVYNMLLFRPGFNLCVVVICSPRFNSLNYMFVVCSPGWSRAYSTVAVSAGPAPLARQAAYDPLDRQRLRVLHYSPRGHRQAVGCQEEQTSHELRQAKPWSSLLLQ